MEATAHESAGRDERLARAARDDHRYLLGIAVRALGSVSEAEDAVQEAYARLTTQLDQVEDVRGWLTVVVSRICVDRLRSAERRRRSPIPLHELPLAERRSEDPADRVTLDDEVRLALQVVMTRLTPAERIAFVLHDVFGYSFAAVGEVLGRSPAACRQLASRARRTIDPTAPGVPADPDHLGAHRVAEQFITACSTGDVGAMVSLMAPTCTSTVDIGVEVGEEVDLPGYGRRRHGPPVSGRDALARILVRFNGPGSMVTLLALPGVGDPTVVGIHDGRVVIFTTMTVEDGLVTRTETVLDPVKLARLGPVLDTAPLTPPDPSGPARPRRHDIQPTRRTHP